jgi:hypothetical protein
MTPLRHNGDTKRHARLHGPAFARLRSGLAT